MCVVMIVIGLYVSCGYSQDKPSEDIMKGIIYQLVIPFYGSWTGESDGSVYTNVIYNTFQVTHSFFKKGSDGRDRYYVEVTYDISYTFTQKFRGEFQPSKNDNVKGKVEKFSFLKKGDDWYGNKGWDIQ